MADDKKPIQDFVDVTWLKEHVGDGAASEYATALREKGFDTKTALRTFKEEKDFDVLLPVNVKIGHRRAILEAIKKEQGILSRFSSDQFKRLIFLPFCSLLDNNNNNNCSQVRTNNITSYLTRLLCARLCSTVGWQRDLLHEGIEPNPGPAWEEIVAAIGKKTPIEGNQRLKTALANLKTAIENTYQDLPVIMDDDITRYYNDANVNRSREVESIRKLVLEAIGSFGKSIQFTIYIQAIIFFTLLFFIFFIIAPPPTTGTYLHHIKFSLFAFTIHLDWVRNLTIEGIEPNPGPAWRDLERTMKELMG